jgi:short-subunit dehydrogenase
MRVRSKVIVVTGGGDGIGRELVLLLLTRGAIVAAVDKNEAGLRKTMELAGDKKDDLSTFTADIANKESVRALPDLVIARHGVVDGIINDAGIIQPFVRLNDLDYEAIEQVMNTNFYGTLYMTKAFLPRLLKRPEAHIANISSMGGFLPVPGQTVYGASKAAVKLLTEGLYSELLNTNVHVSVIFPGAIGTNIVENSGVGDTMKVDRDNSPIKFMEPSKAARVIVDGMERNRYRIMVGVDSTFMDSMCRLSPRRACELVYKQMKAVLPE